MNKYLNIDYWKSRLFDLEVWWYWFAKGWPNKRRCGQCAGCGRYASEMMARYGSEDDVCGMCNGTGLVRRRY